MIKNGIVTHALLGILVSTKLFATANAPIQRIDVVNMLSNNGSQVTQTSVVLAFENGGSTPCFTTTLAFQAATTVWAGTDQACGAGITGVTISPVAGPAGIVVYNAPTPPTLNSSLYSTQMIISQNTAPLFDASNGLIIAAGTAQVTTLSQLAKNT